jgi:pyruvate kinase
MNFSHGSYEVCPTNAAGGELKAYMRSKYHQSVIDNARESEKQQGGRPLAIALDTVGGISPPRIAIVSYIMATADLCILQKGPEIRTGNTPNNDDIPIKAGTELNITTDDKYATASDDKNL